MYKRNVLFKECIIVILRNILVHMSCLYIIVCTLVVTKRALSTLDYVTFLCLCLAFIKDSYSYLMTWYVCCKIAVTTKHNKRVINIKYWTSLWGSIWTIDGYCFNIYSMLSSCKYVLQHIIESTLKQIYFVCRWWSRFV